MEQYLKNEYNVFEDEKYLTNENQIEDYFKDNGREWLDCGQGYATSEVTILCKINEKFYKVKIIAEIGSEWQDRGDKLYFVDYISSVKYEETEKPKPKDRTDILYKLNITKEQQGLLEKYMNEIHINYLNN